MRDAGMTTMEVKKINRSRVYQTIYSERSLSKQEIALKLQMGLTTVTQNLKALEEEGLICRSGYFASTGGRKAQAIEIVKNARTAVGVFILKKKVILTAVDLYGDLLGQKEVGMEFVPADGYYQQLGQEVTQFVLGLEPDPARISGVGIAMQGIISPDGSAVKYGKLLQHTGLTAADLTRYIPYDCLLEHDSKAAARAEIWKQPALRDAVVLLINKNLGSALVIGGEVHGGKSMHSGTMEHMCVVPDGRECYCGGKGCLESYVSADSLRREINGQDFDTFFAAVRSGEPESSAVWERYLAVLADAIRNINTVIDCDIILSGYLAPYFTEQDLETLKGMVTALPFFADRDFSITLGQYGELAPAIGAALPFVRKSLAEI